jgi:hypothetical protein
LSPISIPIQSHNRAGARLSLNTSATHTPASTFNPSGLRKNRNGLKASSTTLVKNMGGLKAASSGLRNKPSGLQATSSGLRNKPSGLQATSSGLKHKPSGLKDKP